MAAKKVKQRVSVATKTRVTKATGKVRPKGTDSVRSEVKNDGLRASNAGSALREGDKLPLAELLDQDGNKVLLSSYKGSRLVLYFYPKDATPGCTREACNFQANLGAFKKAKVAVVGVSFDPVHKHRSFADKYGLSFPLLVDEDRKFSTACGVIGEKVLYGKTSIGMIRTTFVVDGKGVIRRIFRKVKVDGHLDEVLVALKDLG